MSKRHAMGSEGEEANGGRRGDCTFNLLFCDSIFRTVNQTDRRMHFHPSHTTGTGPWAAFSTDLFCISVWCFGADFRPLGSGERRIGNCLLRGR